MELYNNFNQKNTSKNSLDNLLLINIVDIKMEDMNINQHYYEQHGNGYLKKKKPLNFNLYCFIHSTFCNEKYLEGYEYLSYIISYFHTNSNFTNENTIEILNDNLSEFDVKIINDNTNYFSKLNIPYIPSILLKIGLIPIYAEENLETTYAGIKNF